MHLLSAQPYKSRVLSVVNYCSLSPQLFASCSSTKFHDHQHEEIETQEGQHLKQKEIFSLYSPSRIQKLIASQSDPLLAKEIFELASHQPNFRHTYASFHILILKLGRSWHFPFMQSLLSSLKLQDYSISPSLFSQIIQIYGDAGLPNEALQIFYRILEFNITPLPKHLNRILDILIAHRNFLRPAFDLIRLAYKYGVSPNTVSYNILMRAFCLNGDLSIAYSLFNQMSKRNVVPDVESYKILIQGLCRKSQVNKAVDLLQDMLNKGFVPDTCSYSTLLNNMCRKKQLKEAYKLLCRMKLKGCNPDIVHYNTVILGFCREGRVLDACKVLKNMPPSGCLPNLMSYGTIIGGLCKQGLYGEARKYLGETLSKGFAPHFSVVHLLVKGFCNIGNLEEACGVLEEILRHLQTPHIDTWMEILPRISDVDGKERFDNIFNVVLKIDIKPDTRILEVGSCLEEYLIKKKAAVL